MPQALIHLFRSSDGKIPVQEWIDALKKNEPKAHAKCLAHIRRLERFGYELRRPTVGHLGDGILELRWRLRKVQFRILFFFNGAQRNAVVMTNGCKKEGEVPQVEIDRAKVCRTLFEQNPRAHQAEWKRSGR